MKVRSPTNPLDVFFLMIVAAKVAMILIALPIN